MSEKTLFLAWQDEWLSMRTTIHIDDHLFAEIKRIAADTGTAPAGVIPDVLRDSLSRRRAAERPAIDLPSHFPLLPSNFKLPPARRDG